MALANHVKFFADGRGSLDGRGRSGAWGDPDGGLQMSTDGEAGDIQNGDHLLLTAGAEPVQLLKAKQCESAHAFPAVSIYTARGITLQNPWKKSKYFPRSDRKPTVSLACFSHQVLSLGKGVFAVWQKVD